MRSREKIRYHFYHFKGQLPLVFARKCDSLRVSANAVLFYNSGCRHPLRHALRSRVSGLRNRRVLQRVAVACREPSFRYTAGVPVVYLAWTDVISSGVMDVSQVNNNLVSCLLFLFARCCVVVPEKSVWRRYLT